MAAMVLYRALNDGNIAGKEVADLGTGNGIFAVGASLLGASKVYAIDRDKEMIDVAKENAKNTRCEIEFLNMDVKDFEIKIDTALMNPPFGSQKRNADIPFIQKGLELSKNFYIILNYKSGDFLRKFIEGKGEILWEEKIEMPIRHTYDFHRKEVRNIETKIARVSVWNENM